MTRRARQTIGQYARHLPEGVSLKWEPHLKRYRLSTGGGALATVAEEQVYKWKHPQRVFASVARRRMRGEPV